MCRAVAVRHDQAGGPECGTASKNSANIVRVGHLIENHQDAGAGKIFEGGLDQRFSFKQKPLMHGSGPQLAVEGIRIDFFHRRSGARDQLFVARQGISRAPKTQAGALRICKCGCNRMTAINQFGGCKPVGYAYVGSNPTPSTKPRVNLTARLMVHNAGVAQW